ncbi:hypothetical protein D8L93_07455 [Sodalis-like symbiont of Bactericera trigonica]|nr:hypothetical protein D8L93_07455 [Sodalis-like symbiont of Bactericera trigonica]
MAEKKSKPPSLLTCWATCSGRRGCSVKVWSAWDGKAGASLHGLGLRANSLGSQLDRLDHQGQRTFGGLRLGLASVSSGFDHLETSAKAAYGGVARLYGLLGRGRGAVWPEKSFYRRQDQRATRCPKVKKRRPRDCSLSL